LAPCPWVILATWLHLEAPHEIQRNASLCCFKILIISNAFGIGFGHAWLCQKACERCNLFTKAKLFSRDITCPTSYPYNKQPILSPKEFWLLKAHISFNINFMVLNLN
jgi:hypothetical protein